MGPLSISHALLYCKTSETPTRHWPACMTECDSASEKCNFFPLLTMLRGTERWATYTATSVFPGRAKSP
jgi:hypothetical protein